MEFFLCCPSTPLRVTVRLSGVEVGLPKLNDIDSLIQIRNYEYLISWPNIPKPGFYEVRNACRPILASARIEKFVWKPGESMKTELWILNDSQQSASEGSVSASLIMGSQKVVLGTWDFKDLKANVNLRGKEIIALVPDWSDGIVKLVIESEGMPEWNSEYILLINGGTDLN